MKYGIIYKVISPSDKIYIGRSLSKSYERRKRLHIKQANNINSVIYNSAFSRAIRKYDNHLKWTILYKNIPNSKLDDLEILTIKEYNSYYNGYNNTFGGKSNVGIKWSKKSRDKFSKKCIGRKLSEETKAKISKSMKDKKMSKEHKEKISVAHMGKVRNKDVIKRISDTMIKNGTSAGENNGRAKLTWSNVADIRRKYKTGKFTLLQLSNQYEVTKCMIGRIVNNKAWIKNL